MHKRTESAAVFLLAFLALSWNVWNVGIASGYIDSLNKIEAQDESVYTREAIHLATRGDWLNIVYLDRLALFKPPLLMWLSGLSAKLLGIHRLSLRLPSLLAGSLACLVVFWTCRRAAWAAVVLLLSDHLFHVLARVNMTDMLLCASVSAAFYFFLRDPTLRATTSFCGFTIACSCAMLDKSIAGILPIAAAFLFLLLRRASPMRLLQAAAAALALALPWHLYQFLTHRDWFVAEYIVKQYFAFAGLPPQRSQENQIFFYLRRLWLTDPVLAILPLLALPAWWKRRSEPLSALLLCWICIFTASFAAFQNRSIPYLLPLLPALAIVAAEYCPRIDARPALAALCVIFFVKALLPTQLWGNSFQGGTTLALAQPLSDYCELQRPNDLFILEPNDEFYSSVLPLTHVRYTWADPSDAAFQLEPHLHHLGILLQPAEFAALPANQRLYEQRLQAWGLATSKPIATAIAAHSRDDFAPILLSHPGTDFLLPRDLVPAPLLATHLLRPAAQDRVFLISRQPNHEPWTGPRWSCHL